MIQSVVIAFHFEHTIPPPSMACLAVFACKISNLVWRPPVLLAYFATHTIFKDIALAMFVCFLLWMKEGKEWTRDDIMGAIKNMAHEVHCINVAGTCMGIAAEGDMI